MGNKCRSSNNSGKFMDLKPSSDAIKIERLDFEDVATYAKQVMETENGFANTKACWEGNCLNFLTEIIHHGNIDSKRPRVMLLFSNPHPESVRQGLFMSEGRSRGFWEILKSIEQLEMGNYHFSWDEKGIRKTVSLLLKGDYGGPLLFFDCLYQIPSKSPKDIKKLFRPRSDGFNKYIQKPSLERIGKILKQYNIKTVIVFTGETFESIVNIPTISNGSRGKLCEYTQQALRNENSQEVFINCMMEGGLIQEVVLPGFQGSVKAIKVMDTRAKDWWKINGLSTFAHVLKFALKYACSRKY